MPCSLPIALHASPVPLHCNACPRTVPNAPMRGANFRRSRSYSCSEFAAPPHLHADRRYAHNASVHPRLKVAMFPEHPELPVRSDCCNSSGNLPPNAQTNPPLPETRQKMPTALMRLRCLLRPSVLEIYPRVSLRAESQSPVHAGRCRQLLPKVFDQNSLHPLGDPPKMIEYHDRAKFEANQKSSKEENRIIALSANAMLQDIEIGKEAGFFSYLTKPIKIKEFMNALNSALEFAETGNGQSE